ncbi:MAG: TolC family protein [Opitutaceae bacterium]
MRLSRLSFVFALPCAGVFAAENPAALTLDQALASVENVNVTVLLSREAAAQAVEQANVSRVSLLPIVTGNSSQRRSKSVALTNSGVTSSAPTNRFDATFNGTFSLLDGVRWSSYRAARIGIEVARADYNGVVQSVLASIAQSYFAHLRNLRRLDVLDNNIARARVLLELATNQLRAGIATQIDVTRAEAQVAVAEQARLQQLTTVFQSELTLKRALDLNPAQPLRLADVVLRRVDAGVTIVDDEKATFDKRPDYIRAQKAVEQAKQDVRTATFQRLPSLTVGGSFGWGAANFDDEKGRQWSANAGISVPIFDGLRAGADRRSALSRRRAQELRLHGVELQISSELRLAMQDASSRNAQVTVAEKSLQLAEDELRLAEQRYRQGVADNREVVEAQNRRAIAADNAVEAVYQYNLSRVEQARVRGEVRTVLSEKVP